MMNERQRYRETIRFGHPDCIPFDPGWPRESTLQAWHQQGLTHDADWRDALWQVLGLPLTVESSLPSLDINFAMIPSFEEKVLQHVGNHVIVQDAMGAVVEISDRYDFTYLRSAKDFVTRRWHAFPVQNRQDWEEKVHWRYDPLATARFPIDFTTRCRTLSQRDTLLRLNINGPFWQLREWCGFEGLCILMAEQPEFVQEMVDFWSDFIAHMLVSILSQIDIDFVQISEDMAYKEHSMISPSMTRRFLLPVWQRWTSLLKSKDCIVSIDSDGYIGELIPFWIEAGIDHTWPVEVAAGNDLLLYRKKYAHSMAYGAGIDKRALAAGGEAMYRELQRVAPVIREGGYIPSCDHGVPPDVSWPNFVDYSRLLAQLTGWL